MKSVVAVTLFVFALAAPRFAQAGVFFGMERDRVDPSQGEKPTLLVTFDDALFRALVTVTAEGGFKQEWAVPSVVVGKDLRYTFTPPRGGEVMYSITVLMVAKDGTEETQENVAYVVSAAPITARIPAEEVDLDTRTFRLHTNHAPATVRMQVMSDAMDVLGDVTTAVPPEHPAGTPVTCTWPLDGKGNVLRVLVTVTDAFGYYSEVEIIPWSLNIPHEDVIFPSGSHEILAEETPKVDRAWSQIAAAITRYGELVQVTLFVAGYTDTVGDGPSNQSLSERRARALAEYFKRAGARLTIHYQGFGESVLAKTTADGVDEAANRRALYVLTAGPPPRTSDTPRASWKKL